MSSKQPSHWPIWLLLAISLFVRGRVLQTFMRQLLRDPDNYRELAESLAEYGTLGFLFGNGPIPTAYRPPLYPLLLAPSSLLGGYGLLAVGALHVSLGLLSVWLVWRLGLRWQLPRWAALLAAALIAVDPLLVYQASQIMTETLAALLTVVALHGLTSAMSSPSAPSAAAAGACLGCCALCRPTYFVWLALVLVALPAFVSGWKTRAGLMAAFVLGAALPIAPWAIRNQISLGSPIITTTHGGYTLLLGNNPLYYQHLREAVWGEVWDSDEFDRPWERLRAERPTEEIELDQLAYDAAWRNMREQPLMAAYAALVRVGSLWGLVPHQLDAQEASSFRLLRYAIGGWYAIELFLVAVGLIVLRGKLVRSAWLWGLLLLLGFTAVHTLYWTDMRMRAPLMPAVALFAAAGARWLAKRAEPEAAL